jgi:hypothetical protein
MRFLFCSHQFCDSTDEVYISSVSCNCLTRSSNLVASAGVGGTGRPPSISVIAITNRDESVPVDVSENSGCRLTPELAALETFPFFPRRFLRRHAAGMTCNTFYQQYGDIVLIEFRIYQGFEIGHCSPRTLGESITQTILGMLAPNRVSQAICEYKEGATSAKNRYTSFVLRVVEQPQGRAGGFQRCR